MSSDNIHIFEYLHLLRRRKFTLMVSFGAVFALVCLVNLLQKPVYRTSVELMAEQDRTKLVLGTNVLTVDNFDDTYFFTQERVLKSRPLAEEVLKRAVENPMNLGYLLDCFGMAHLKKGETLSQNQRETLIGSLQGAVELNPMPKTRIFYISATGNASAAVAHVANAVSEAFIDYNAQTLLSTSQQAFIGFGAKLHELKDRLNLSEFALQKIQLELKFADMLKIYEDKHPEVIKMRDQIENHSNYLKQQLDKVRQTLGSDEEARARRESVLFSYLNNEDARQGQGMEDRKSLAMFLEQEVATNREIYNTFFKKWQEMNLGNDATTVTKIKIIQDASVPRKPIRPNRPLNLLFGCVVGLTLGIGLAFFQDYLDNTIKTSDDIQKHLDLTVLGIIPGATKVVRSGNGNTAGDRTDHSQRLMTLIDSNSSNAEAYRTLRTNILLASVDKPLRTLVVTSSVQKEGKSTTAINLAISIARSGSRVVLVDADLRRPVLAKTFGMDSRTKPDLVDLLTGGASLDDALFSTDVDNLTVLACTKIPPNPSELLGSKKMLGIMEALKEKFDLVLLDSPPLVAVTDAVVLSTKVDGVLFVVSAGAVPRGLCMQAKSSLENAKINILGVVLNNVTMDHSSYNYYHHYRYYNSYAGSAPSSREVALSR